MEELNDHVIEYLKCCDIAVDLGLKNVLTFYSSVGEYVNSIHSDVSLKHNRVSGINLIKSYPSSFNESDILKLIEGFVGSNKYSHIFNPEYFFVNPDYREVPYERVLGEAKIIAYEFNSILWRRYKNNKEAYEFVLYFPESYIKYLNNDNCYLLHSLAGKYHGAYDDIKSKIDEGYSKIQIPLSMYKNASVRETKILERILNEKFNIDFIY